jgi:serine palmitoyltransferase
MRNTTSYLTAFSQAGADARRKAATDDDPSEAFSLGSSLRTDDDMSYLTNDDSNFDDSDDHLDRSPHPPNSEQVFTTRHSEFGHCANETYRHTSGYVQGTAIMPHVEEDPPYYILLTTYFSYLLMILFGHLRDFVGKRFVPGSYRHLMSSDVSFFHASR